MLMIKQCSIIISQIMSFLKELKHAISKADLFSASQILRYKGETSYKTISGGIISLSLILAVIIAFSSMIISTMQRTTINSTLQVKRPSTLPEIKLNSKDNKFMFSVSLADYFTRSQLSLTSGSNIFSVTFLAVNSLTYNVQYIPLLPCTKQHWSMLPEVQQNFDRLQFGKMLCPPTNINLPVGGFSYAPDYKFGVIQIHPCINSTFNGNSCAPQTDIDAAFSDNQNYYLKMAIANPIINPNQPNHIDYYLENKNYLIFSRNQGAQMSIEFSDYKIDSDQSILPFENIKTESGYILEDKASVFSYSIGLNNALASVVLAKSPKVLLYKRKVLKLEEVISYIGGLLGATVAVLCLFRIYTEVSLELNIGIDLFKQSISQKKKKIQPQNKKLEFNIGTFISLYWYKFLKRFNKGESFKASKKLQKYQKEIDMQLDIRILLERLMKIEACMMYIFDKQDVQGIRNIREITLQRAHQLRTFLHAKQDVAQAEKEKIEPQEEPQEETQENQLIEIKRENLNENQFIESNKRKQDESGFSILKKQPHNQSVTIPVRFISKQEQHHYQQNIINGEVIQKRSPKQSKDKGFTYKKKLDKLKNLNNHARDSDLKLKIWKDVREDVKKRVINADYQDQIQEIAFNNKQSQLNNQ